VSDLPGSTRANLPNGADAVSNPVSPMQKPWNYEMTVRQVETIITQLESGELELEEVFAQFSVAVEQLNRCEAFLKQRQQQMDLMIETLTDDAQF
jgi:exodeoxyribonuclease VII small subunit